MTETANTASHMCSAHDCGAPAAVSWTSTRSGVTYWECHNCAPSGAAPIGEPHVGAEWVISHIGVEKTGTIRKMTETFVWVEVPTYGGERSSVVKARR